MRGFRRLRQIQNADARSIFAEAVGKDAVGGVRAVQVQDSMAVGVEADGILASGIEHPDGLNLEDLPRAVSYLDFNFRKCKSRVRVHPQKTDKIGLPGEAAADQGDLLSATELVPEGRIRHRVSWIFRGVKPSLIYFRAETGGQDIGRRCGGTHGVDSRRLMGCKFHLGLPTRLLSTGENTGE